jgi:tetratricopeptide (TPR) repeat protein
VVLALVGCSKPPQPPKAYSVADWEAEMRQRPTPENYLGLSLARYNAGNYQGCIDAAREALKFRPNYTDAYVNIGAAYAKMERWEESIQATQEALRLDPNAQLAKNNLAWAEEGKKAAAAKAK